MVVDMISTLHPFISDKAFNKKVFLLAFPIVLQGFLTQLVSLADNIMIGQLGSLPVAAISISNRIIFIMNLAIFGSISGAEIFGTQFFGNRDYKNEARIFWMKGLFSFSFGILTIALLTFFQKPLLSLWLHDTKQNTAAALSYAHEYLTALYFGIPFYCLSQAAVSTLKENGRTIICMESAVFALALNLVGDYLLIFGHFFFPALGCKGAAIATSISRMGECVFVLFWIIIHHNQLPFTDCLFEGLHLDRNLTIDVMKKAVPLMSNEILWSIGLAFFSACYSTRGLAAISALAIVDVAVQIFKTLYTSIGSVISILIGQELGKGKIENAVEKDKKLIVMAVLAALAAMVLSTIISPLFASLYNVDASIRQMAVTLIRIEALLSPLNSFNFACYFTIRSGGNTMVTFFMDAGLTWIIGGPLVYLLSRSTLEIFPLYFLSQLYLVLKIIPMSQYVHSRRWARNLTGQMNREKGRAAACQV